MNIKKIIYFIIGIFIFQIPVTYSQTPLKNETQTGYIQPALTDNNGFKILPESGDYAIGFNAIPALCFIGNAFNANINNIFIGQNKFASNLGQNVIFGKYMLSDNTVIRAHFRFGVKNETLNNNVTDDTKTSPDSLVTDKATINNSCSVFGLGYEFRRGKGKVQGIYGGDVFFQRIGNKESYEYANAYSLSNQTATTTTNFVTGACSPQVERLLSIKGGSNYGLGIRPFVGIEYFFTSKISFGSEFGWNILYAKTTETESVFETYDTSSELSVSKKKINPSSNVWTIDTDNFNGALFLMFYF